MAEQSSPAARRLTPEDGDGLRPARGVDRIGDALAPGAVPGGPQLPGTEAGHFEPAGAPTGETVPGPPEQGPGTNEQRRTGT